MALIHIGFFSEALGMCVNCDVVLPQTASGQIGMAAQARDGRHPTLWLLHGASDDHTVWQRRTSIERYAAPLGLAVVMPAVQLSSMACSSRTAAPTVMPMLVPVSPSGTGKTFSSSTRER